MESKRELPVMAFPSQGEWEAWLAAHHDTAKGLWLKIAKKSSSIESVSYAEALESALCYGWIDGQKRALDERFWLQKFTPRGRRSTWSRVNRDKVAELTRQGRMRPAGLAQVELARQDGRWEAAYDSPRNATVPEDLQRELERNPTAAAFFATLDHGNRYAVLYRLQTANRPETRARRLEQLVAMLNEGRKLHP